MAYTDEQKIHIGETIKAKREESGLSLSQMGEIVGISKGTLSQLENGNRVSEKSVIKFAELFGMTTEEIIGKQEATMAGNEAAKKIIDLMVEQKKTNQDLASRIDVNADYMAALLGGRAKFTDEQLRTIAMYLGVDFTYLKGSNIKNAEVHFDNKRADEAKAARQRKADMDKKREKIDALQYCIDNLGRMEGNASIKEHVYYQLSYIKVDLEKDILFG